MEFSPPRIHSPYYHIDDTCNPYAKDDKLFLETFQKHYNYPSSSRAEDSASSSSLVRSSSVIAVVAAALLLLHRYSD